MASVARVFVPNPRNLPEDSPITVIPQQPLSEPATPTPDSGNTEYLPEVMAALQNPVLAAFLPANHAEIQAIIDGGKPELSKEYQDALYGAIAKFKEASKPMTALAFLIKDLPTRCEKALALWEKAQIEAAEASKKSEALQEAEAKTAEAEAKRAVAEATIAEKMAYIAELEAQLAAKSSKRRKVEA